MKCPWSQFNRDEVDGIQPAQGWPGYRGTEALIGDATAKRLRVVNRRNGCMAG